MINGSNNSKNRIGGIQENYGDRSWPAIVHYYIMACCSVGNFYLLDIEKIGIFSSGCPSIVIRFPNLYYESDFYEPGSISLKETQSNELRSFVRRFLINYTIGNR